MKNKITSLLIFFASSSGLAAPFATCIGTNGHQMTFDKMTVDSKSHPGCEGGQAHFHVVNDRVLFNLRANAQWQNCSKSKTISEVVTAEGYVLQFREQGHQFQGWLRSSRGGKTISTFTCRIP